MKRDHRKKDFFEWWKDRITMLTGFKDEARKLYGLTNIAYEPGSWAILKLAILGYYIDVYTTIMKSIFGKASYIDLFSGPGLNAIQNTGTVVFGSPLIADRVPKPNKKFDALLLIEQRSDYAKVLRTLLPKAETIEDDVNEGGLREALNLNPEGTPCLAFVDPEGLELKWTTLELLVKTWCDVIINFQISGIKRAVGSVSKSPSYASTLDSYFGTDKWRECKDDSDYLELYEGQIKKYKDYTIHIKVQGPGSFYYFIIVAIRKTSGTQNWISAIERAKENIEKVDYAFAESLLKVFEGKQATLF